MKYKLEATIKHFERRINLIEERLKNSSSILTDNAITHLEAKKEAYEEILEWLN